MPDRKSNSKKANTAAPLNGLLVRHYKTLRALAERILAQQTLMQKAAGPDRVSPSSLVAEATLRLLLQRTELKNDEHLHGLAALSMQRTLKDRARKRGAKRRTMGDARIQDAVAPAAAESDLMHELDALRLMQPRQAAVLAIVGMEGMTIEQAAKKLGVSKPTAERDLRMARAWLSRRLHGS